MRSPLLCGLGLLLAAVASSQEQPQLKARELFYTPITEMKAPVVKSVAPKPVRRNTKDGDDSANQASRRPQPATRTESPKVQNASIVVQEVGPPLALKYRLLKRNSDGRYDEVDTDTVFHSGDKIRVSVEANDDGHLYIVQQGSSKTWNLLFPNEATERGNNQIQHNKEYEIPGGGRFTFDEQPGAERMFIVLSRRAEPDLEQLIYALSQGGGTTPASTEKATGAAKMMLAHSRIDDAVIERLRGRVMARDLVFEKVNDEAPVTTSGGTRKEKALYVATPDRTINARVVVDLTLKHQ